MLLGPIQNLLQSAPRLIQGLGDWDFGDGANRPAVFTMEPPMGSPRPCVILEQNSSTRNGTRARRGSRVSLTALVMGDRDATDKILRGVANEVWRTIDRARVVSSGYDVLPLAAESPTRGATDADGFPSYSISIEALIFEEVN